MDTHLAQGVLFYTGIYINTILVIVSFLTGRFIFIFFIVLTLALIFFMNYLVIENNSHIKQMGEWVEQIFKNTLIK